MLGAIESLLSAVVADGMAGTRHDRTRSSSVGLAESGHAVFGGFAATGAIARTATNVRHGGTRPLAGIVHAVVLLLVLLVLAPLASDVPLCALAAVLFVVAWNMSDLRHFGGLVRRAPRADVAILLITFALTVFADLVITVNVGVILSMFQFLRRMSSAVEVGPLGGAELDAELVRRGWRQLPARRHGLFDRRPFFFGAVDNFERALAQTHTDPRVLIIRLRRVPFIDITGLLALEEAVHDLRKRGVRVVLCEANERVRAKLGGGRPGAPAWTGRLSHGPGSGPCAMPSPSPLPRPRSRVRGWCRPASRPPYSRAGRGGTMRAVICREPTGVEELCALAACVQGTPIASSSAWMESQRASISANRAASSRRGASPTGFRRRARPRRSQGRRVAHRAPACRAADPS